MGQIVIQYYLDIFALKPFQTFSNAHLQNRPSLSLHHSVNLQQIHWSCFYFSFKDLSQRLLLPISTSASINLTGTLLSSVHGKNLVFVAMALRGRVRPGRVVVVVAAMGSGAKHRRAGRHG